MTVTHDPTPPNPMTLDWFKSNCALLENGIATDYSDPMNHLQLLQGWIGWVETSDAPSDCVFYFYDVCLLKITNSLLTKKYQNNETHILKAKETLERIAQTLGKNLLQFPEPISEILATLFVQKHPFYLKYGYPKIMNVTKEPPEDMSWTSRLTAGDCLDGKSGTGEWEIIVIDEVSSNGSEVYVTWGSGVSEWIRLENNPNIAKFGSKTDIYGDGPKVEEVPSPVPENAVVNDITGLSEEEDFQWRTTLAVGDLIDAKDKTGAWYQACILELAHVESTASVNDPDKQQHPNCQNSDLDMNIEEKNNMDVMKAELFAVKNPVPTVSNEMEVSSNDVSPTITVVTTYLRISFLGWMEFYDDWIELSSAAGRLAPLNTKSFGNRGENNVREEVKFLAKLWEKKSQSSPTNYATSPEPALVSPFYATVVNQFFISKGILNFQKLIAEKMLESCNLTSSSNLKLIFSVGLCADVLTSRFFEVNITSDDSMFGALVSYVKRYFQFLLQEELRATKTESFEQIIWSLERILKSHGFLLKDVAQELDPLYVAVALGCIQSPYLNRRLGGLKIMTDLLRRQEESVLYPNYLRVTRSASTPASTSSVASTNTSSSSTFTLPMCSYTFIPPCTLTVDQLCQTIRSIIPPLFVGDAAHEALMQRSSELLKYLCKYDYFDDNLLSMLLEIGCVLKNAIVLQVIQDLIPNSFNVKILEVLSSYLSALGVTLVSQQVADILGAIATRCRTILLEIPGDSQHVTHIQPVVQYSHHECLESTNNIQMSDDNLFLVHKVHHLSLSSLFQWAEDGSGVEDSVSIRCVSKVESVMELGMNISRAIHAGCFFPWDQHWKRCYETILRALTCLQSKKSILLSIKTIKTFLLSWVKEDDFIKANIIMNTTTPSEFIPPKYFYRHCISEYFEDNYHVTDLLIHAIIHIKAQFNEISTRIISESLSTESTSHTSTLIDNAYKLSLELQSVLNGIMINNSRIGYKDLLELILEFINTWARSSSALKIPMSAVKLIWNHVLKSAITPQERDLVFNNFLNRLIVNKSSVSTSTSNSSTSTSTMQQFIGPKPPPSNESTSGESKDNNNLLTLSTFGRLSFLIDGGVPIVYNELLCDTEFIISEHFSLSALYCLEKYYKWISANNGSLVELPGNKEKDGVGGGGVGGGFIILKSLSLQNEWEIFPKIVMYCHDDKVALDAVKFLTTFPQRLSQSLVYAGDVITLRQSILSQSMRELENICNETHGIESITSSSSTTTSTSNSIVLYRKLKRAIMLLNALLDESSADSSKRIKSHGGKWKNKEIILKIQYTKQGITSLTFDSSDTLDDLLQSIANYFHKEVQHLKFFRRGSELTINNLIKRTLQQMDFTMNETIVIADRPLTSTPIYNFNKPYQCPLETLPGVILSSKPEYLEILFTLLDRTEGLICNEIWELIIRLPTSPYILNTWKCLISAHDTGEHGGGSGGNDDDDHQANHSSLINLFILHSNQYDSFGKRIKISHSISRLIYNLQIIESFFHSSSVIHQNEDHTSNTSGGGVEFDDDENELWIGMFIALGGIKSLEEAFVYIIQQCSLYCSPHSQESRAGGGGVVCGVTSKLLLCAMHLITKIIRAIMIRGVLCARPLLFSEISSLVKSISHITTSKGGLVDKDHDDTSAGTSKSQDEQKLNHIDEREQFLLNEWGNKFDAHFDVTNPSSTSSGTSSTSIIESVINLYQIQSTILKFLLIIPSYANDSLFSITNQSINLLSVREQIQNYQLEYIQCFQNIYIIWGCVLILDPRMSLLLLSQSSSSSGTITTTTPTTTTTSPTTTTNGIKDFSLKELLISLLMKFPSLENTTSTSSSSTSSTEVLHKFSSIVGYSLMMGLMCILTLIENFVDNYELRNHIIDILLTLRPSSSLDHHQSNGNGPMKVVNESSNCDNLFIFLSELLSSSSSHLNQQSTTTSNISTTTSTSKKFHLQESKVLEVCYQIYQEFLEIVKLNENKYKNQQLYCSGKYQNISVIKNFSGNMRLLQSLLQNTSSATILEWMLQQGIIEFLLNICLGIRPTNSISLNILCNDSDTRMQSYNILQYFLNDCERTSKIFQSITLAHTTLEEPNQWSFNPVRDMRSSVGYVGLRNMGCTCYMNSLLQILYMNPQIRQHILHANIPTTTTTTTPEMELQLKDNLLYQLQIMFQFLLHSTRKSFSPDAWMFAYKDETGLLPVNVLQQQDAQEFLQVLCERMEKILIIQTSNGHNHNNGSQEEKKEEGEGEIEEKEQGPPTPTPSTTTTTTATIPLLSSIYGVEICDQMIKQGVDLILTENRNQYIREKNDMMMCISLDVRGTNGLESSLKKFVSGESLSDYLWDENQPRVNIIKRQCIGKLSNSIIFHLKRFELNFDTFLREKVNDEFPFPTFIDMYPYTKEGLEGILPQSLNKSSTDYFYELTGIVVHTGTTDSGHYYSYIKESREDALERYTTLQHGKISSEGHKDEIPSNIPRRWIEFNDSEIQLFSELRIPGECFGGYLAEHEFTISTQTWASSNTPNPKSAYMLIYQRINETTPTPTTTPHVTPPAPDTTTSTPAPPTPSDDTSDMKLDSCIYPPQQVIKDNQCHLLATRCYTYEHIQFIIQLEKNYLLNYPLYSCPEEEFSLIKDSLQCNITEYISFLTRYVSRSLYPQFFHSGCELIINLLDNFLLLIQSPSLPTTTPTPTHPSSSSSSSSSTYLPSSSTSTSVTSSSSSSSRPTLAINSIRSQFCFDLCHTLMSYFIHSQNGQLIQNLIFSPEKIIRDTTTKLLFKLFSILMNFSKNYEQEIKSLPPVLIKLEILTPCSIEELPEYEQHEIQLISNTLPSYIQFLLLITKNSYFLQCSELWRRSDSYLSLLLQLTQLNLIIRIFLIQRDIIKQGIDLILGEYSPLNGELYLKGSRKYAPTSYITIVPGKGGKLPTSSQYTPDWTDLLQILALLVQSTLSPNRLRSMHTTSSTSSLISDYYILDPSNYRLLQTKLFYAHTLRQYRYITSLSLIISHLSYEDRNYSIDCIAEVITEGLSYATLDSISQYFDILEIFLLITDNIQNNRMLYFFDISNGTIMQIIKNFMINKPQYVCIVIQSLFTLIKKVYHLFYIFKNRLSDWAPLILKFCYQYYQKTSQEYYTSTSNTTATTSTSTTTSTSASTTTTAPATTNNNESTTTMKKGLYMRIYGEGEDERELNNMERALKTFNLVQDVMRSMNAVPDAYIPVDAFETLPGNDDTDDIPVEALAQIIDQESKSSSSMNVGTGTIDLGFSDAMTDEEFERYLASNLD